jgi:hypothetical protein
LFGVRNIIPVLSESMGSLLFELGYDIGKD